MWRVSSYRVRSCGPVRLIGGSAASATSARTRGSRRSPRTRGTLRACAERRAVQAPAARDGREKLAAENPCPTPLHVHRMHVVGEAVLLAGVVKRDRDELRRSLRHALDLNALVPHVEHAEDLVARREIRAHALRTGDVLRLGDELLVTRVKLLPLQAPLAVDLLAEDPRHEDSGASDARGRGAGRHGAGGPAACDHENDCCEREDDPHRRSLFDSMSNHMAKSVNWEPEMSNSAIR